VFDGLNEPGLGASEAGGEIPPDPTGSIGPNYYIEMVNSMVAVYDRSTLTSPPVAELDEASFVNSALGSAASAPCDGQLQWDQEGGRWLYVALECGEAPNALYYGWSKTDVPTDLVNGWCKYTLPTGTALEDYPKLGHDDNHILIGANEFEVNVPGAGVASGRAVARLFVIPKPARSVSNCPTPSPTDTSLTVTSFSLTDQWPTLAGIGPSVPLAVDPPEPANIADGSATGYVVATKDNTDLAMFEVSGAPSAAVLTAEPDIVVPSFNTPAAAPQPGGTNPLDTSDTRLTMAVAHIDPALGGEAVWTQHTVAGPGGGPSVMRWYELKPGARTPVQTGTVDLSAKGLFVFNGAISPTADGKGAAVFYNTASNSHLVDLRAQVRNAAMAPGTVSGETILGTSDAIDVDFSCPSALGSTSKSCRWGDYAGASPDPSNLNVVWGSGMLNGPGQSGSAQWKTRNYAVVDTPPVGPAVSVSLGWRRAR
jgi:hypothetical protein